MVNKYFYVLFGFTSLTNIAYAQTDTSTSYAGGKLVGYIFMAIFLVLIIRKFMKKD